MHTYPWQTDPTPPPIKHRCMQNHYTQYVLHIEECTYTLGRWPPPINHRSMLHYYIKEVSHITECTYTHDRLTSWPIDHRSMLHCYTFPCQLTIDPCYTITPHKCHSAQCTYTHGRPIHKSSFTSSRMPWQTYPTPSSNQAYIS